PRRVALPALERVAHLVPEVFVGGHGSMMDVRRGAAPRTFAGAARPIKVRPARALAGLALAAAALLAPAPAAAQVPPDQDWRTIEGERARITFPAHLEALARRAAWRADVALEELDRAFMPIPEDPID